MSQWKIFLFTCSALLSSAFNTALGQTNLAKLYANLSSSRSDSERLTAYTAVIYHYFFTDADSSLFYSNKGFEEFSAKKYKKGIAQMALHQGAAYGKLGDMDSAALKYEHSAGVFRQLNDKRGIASANNGLGILNGKKGNNKEAVRYFTEALRDFEAINDTPGIMTTYMKLGLINEQVMELDNALKYYNIAKSYAVNMPKSSQTIALIRNFGVVYGKKRDMPKAIACFEQAAADAHELGLRDIEATSYTNLGMVYTDMSIPNKALRYFDMALATTNQNGTPENNAVMLLNRAGALGLIDPRKGIEGLKEALEVVNKTDPDKMNSKLLLIDIYDDMGVLYVQLGDYEHALNVIQMENELKDSVFNIGKAKELAGLQSAYELEKSKTKVTNLQVQGKRNVAKNNFILVVASVLVLMLILVIVMYRRTNRLNRLLEERERELQKNDAIKDKLFSVIGHDLRGPIGAIPVMLQLLKGHEETANERKRLIGNMIDHATASMATLDKLLYWGQSQIKGVGTKQEVFEVKPYIESNLQLIKNSADQKTITITDNIAQGICICADAAHFDFIMRNLLSNAVKFTYQGGHVSINADADKEEGFVTFWVKDNGIGISEDHAAHIFEPFNSNARGTANEKGNSIGLMLCRDFVRENGGRIWLESKEGNGAVFYFTMKKA